MIYEFGGEYFVSSDNDNFAKLIISKNGEISFKKLNLKTNPTRTKYQIAEHKYIIEDSGLKYLEENDDELPKKFYQRRRSA